MKTISSYFGLALSLLCFTGLGAQQADMFNQVYGGSGYEYGRSVRQTRDDGYLMAGSTSSYGSGLTDGYVVKTDSLGIVQWTKLYGGNNVDWIYSVRELRDSGFVMCGYTNSTGNGGYDGWLIRTDKNGDTLWTKTIGTTDWDFFYSVDTLPNNLGFLLCGGSYGYNTPDEAAYLVRTDASGNVVWARTYGGTKQDVLNDICYNSNNTFSCVGTVKSMGDTLGDIWVMNCSMWGDTLWTFRKGLPGFADAGYGVADFDIQGSFFYCGTLEVNTGDNNSYLTSMTYAGQPTALNVNIGSQVYDDFRSVTVLPGYDFVALGTTYGIGGGYGDMYYYRAYANCYTTFGTLYEDVGYCVSATRDTGSIACGYTVGYNSILPNAFLVKISKTCQSTQVLGIQQQQPLSFAAAARVYPNPVQQNATVLISSQEPIGNAPLRVEAYDLAGRFAGHIEMPGMADIHLHSASIPVGRNGLSAGAYQFRVTAGSRILATGRLIIAD